MQCSNGPCPEWMPILFAAFPLFFAGIWLGAVYLMGVISGWCLLAERYRVTDHMPSGEEMTWQSGGMRKHLMPVRYNNVLNITVAPEGLGLHMMFMFRLGHPKLFIPWGDIEVTEEKSWGRPTAALKIADTGVILVLSSRRAVEAVLTLRGTRR